MQLLTTSVRGTIIKSMIGQLGQYEIEVFTLDCRTSSPTKSKVVRVAVLFLIPSRWWVILMILIGWPIYLGSITTSMISVPYRQSAYRIFHSKMYKLTPTTNSWIVTHFLRITAYLRCSQQPNSPIISSTNTII